MAAQATVFQTARWVLILSALVAAPTFAGDAGPRVVRDPFYGEGLYYFYQERYFSALTHLMASQRFQRLPTQADEAELLRGGLMLSYGLHREAGEIFARLIEAGTVPSVRDRAWFFLGKIRYQRGYFDEAADAFGRIGEALPAAMQDERRLMEANVQMARGDYARAVSMLKGFRPDSDALLYARYNLGVALVKSGELEAGVAQLQSVGAATPKTEELKSLRDKANVALGYAFLQADKPERAKDALEHVRLSGLLASKALLGFGWAQLSLDKASEALVPWSELVDRGQSDAAVLEARIAIPFALGKIGAHSNSLQEYEAALRAYAEEDKRLDASIASIRDGRMLQAVLDANPGPEMGWFWSISELPDLPLREQMAEALAQNEFQEALKNYRDLRFLSENLDRWNGSVGVFRDALAARRQAFAAKLPQALASERVLGAERLESQQHRFSAELDRAEAEFDVAALADEKERVMHERLARVEAVLQRAGNRPDLAAAADRARRVRGALWWRMSSQFRARLWEARKGLKESDAGIARIYAGREALVRAQREMPDKFAQYAARIQEAEQRAAELVRRAAELRLEQRRYVDELAVAELEAQKRRLFTYITQAQFAIAQIYDQAARAAEAGSEPPP
jgi:hypothetical protein